MRQEREKKLLEHSFFQLVYALEKMSPSGFAIASVPSKIKMYETLASNIDVLHAVGKSRMYTIHFAYKSTTISFYKKTVFI